MKKLSLLLIAFVLLLSCFSFADATNGIENILKSPNSLKNQTIIHSETAGSKITPRVVTACPYGNGICDALSSGSGTLYVNNVLKFLNKYAWQCTKCRNVYVTQYNPLTQGTIGIWATQSYTTPISIYGVALYTNTYGTTSGSTIQGVKFRLR